KHLNSFNDAVDEYFSKLDSSNLITPQDQSINQKIKSQEKILRKDY
ncbi:unnamed protein product, partial [marine sediment metagenome]